MLSRPRPAELITAPSPKQTVPTTKRTEFMAATLKATEIPSEMARRIGIPRSKTPGFTKEHVRSRALRLLAEISDLTQDQRRRVLDFALNLNRL
jgi:hypothetical protein